MQMYKVNINLVRYLDYLLNAKDSIPQTDAIRIAFISIFWPFSLPSFSNWRMWGTLIFNHHQFDVSHLFSMNFAKSKSSATNCVCTLHTVYIVQLCCAARQWQHLARNFVFLLLAFWRWVWKISSNLWNFLTMRLEIRWHIIHRIHLCYPPVCACVCVCGHDIIPFPSIPTQPNIRS